MWVGLKREQQQPLPDYQEGWKDLFAVLVPHFQLLDLRLEVVIKCQKKGLMLPPGETSRLFGHILLFFFFVLIITGQTFCIFHCILLLYLII